MRFGDALAYLTDTTVEADSHEFVAGVHTLLHEVWRTDAEAELEGASAGGHSAVSQVAALARAAAVERLFPVHHRPHRTAEELEAIADVLARESGVEVALLREGTLIDVPTGATSGGPV